jgi:hypothetical protein
MNELIIKDGIEYHYNIVQGTDEWLRLKHGVLSASTLKNVITPAKLELSKAAATRLFYDEILSQRIDPTLPDNFMSYDMRRGHEDEPYAVQAYAERYKVEGQYCGFIINTKLGFPFGFSPDWLVGDDGFVEVKSKLPKYQIQTILNHICGRTEDVIPSENMMQCQAGLFVTERKWCDFISYCNGNMMMTSRVFPDPKYQAAIRAAAINFEQVLQENMRLYEDAVANDPRLTPTERRIIEQEITV